MPRAKSPFPKKIGRPEKVINWQIVDGLCKCQCTKAEICSVLDVSEPTLDKAIKKQFGASFLVYFEQKSAGGKASLRHAQYQGAMRGNVALLIWLGKQLLGQRDKVEQVTLNDPLADLVEQMRKRGDVLAASPSPEDPQHPGEQPQSETPDGNEPVRS